MVLEYAKNDAYEAYNLSRRTQLLLDSDQRRVYGGKK